MKTIKFDMISAYHAGATGHPQKVVEGLGLEVFKYEGIPIADCVFMLVDRLPEPMPNYITESTDYKFDTGFFVYGCEVKKDNK